MSHHYDGSSVHALITSPYVVAALLNYERVKVFIYATQIDEADLCGFGSMACRHTIVTPLGSSPGADRSIPSFTFRWREI